MKLKDMGRTGKYKIISKYAVYEYSLDEFKFLTSLVNKEHYLMTDTEIKLKQDLTTGRNVCEKSLTDYRYKYWMNICETVLFGNSDIDCSTIDSDTREYYWRNSPILNYEKRTAIGNHDVKISYEVEGNIGSYYKSSIKDMFDLFSILYHRESKHYINLDRNPKFVSSEEFKDNYKHIEVLNMKWWSKDMPEDISIRGRFNKQLTSY